MVRSTKGLYGVGFRNPHPSLGNGILLIFHLSIHCSKGHCIRRSTTVASATDFVMMATRPYSQAFDSRERCQHLINGFHGLRFCIASCLKLSSVRYAPFFAEFVPFC